MTATQSQTGPSDMDLVHAFVRSRDQGAFTQLVRRHVDMVYATALRRVRGDRHAMSSTDEARTTDDRWDEVEPLLDGALEELSATDRAAVVMRFHQSKSIEQTASALGVSTEAAKKRVQRALAKLRSILSRKGVRVSTTAALATAIASHACGGEGSSGSNVNT